MRVLVTGANGFIGQALVAALQRCGTKVVAAVRRETPLPMGISVSRIGDIGPTTDWREALVGCNAVVHLAARVHVMRDQAADPLASYRRVNVSGTLALARQAAHSGARRFVYLSSIKANGESTAPGRPYREVDEPAPVDPYGISKLEAEQELLALAASTGMEVVIIRPPLVYGPGVRANFHKMMQLLNRGIPLPFGAVHNNRRTLVSLDNLVDLIETCLHHPGSANQVFFGGDGEDLSTTDLLQRTAAALGVRAHLIPIPVPVLVAGATMLGRSGLAQRLCGTLQVDISKAHTLLSWTPPVSVEEGLRRAAAPLRAVRG